jgi:hypothetical protein
VDVVTQTDAFMDQLFAPMFIPMKTGGAWTGRKVLRRLSRVSEFE